MVDFPLQCLSTDLGFFFAEKVGKEEIRFTWGRPLRVFRRLDRLDFRGALRAGRDGSGEHYPHVGRGLELEKPGGLVRTWESFGSKKHCYGSGH